MSLNPPIREAMFKDPKTLSKIWIKFFQSLNTIEGSEEDESDALSIDIAGLIQQTVKTLEDYVTVHERVGAEDVRQLLQELSDFIAVGGVVKFPVAGAAGNTGEVQFNKNGVIGATSYLFWDDTNKRLGIGTSSPNTLLHISKLNSTAVIRLERDDINVSSSDILARIEVETKDSTDPGICASIEALSYGSSSETGWRFKTGTPTALVECLQLSELGNVGIKTPWPDSPSQALEVNGTAIVSEKIGVKSVISPSANLHIGAGTATAATAPLKFTAGTKLTTPEAGAVDYTTALLELQADSFKSLMNRQVNTWHAYGGFQDESETISIATVNVWYHITNATNDLWTGLEAEGISLSGDIMTITNAGDYSGSLSMSFSGSNGKDFQLRVYNITQSAQQGYYIGASTSGAGNFTNVVVPLYLEADAGDTFRMEVRCISDSSDPVFKNAIFNVQYLHD